MENETISLIATTIASAAVAVHQYVQHQRIKNIILDPLERNDGGRRYLDNLLECLVVYFDDNNIARRIFVFIATAQHPPIEDQIFNEVRANFVAGKELPGQDLVRAVIKLLMKADLIRLEWGARYVLTQNGLELAQRLLQLRGLSCEPPLAV
ncbi:MAG TPA: hypothetical protein VGP72_31650 [Planctomycetota bacterium]|jgi:hypothetical protein